MSARSRAMVSLAACGLLGFLLFSLLAGLGQKIFADNPSNQLILNTVSGAIGLGVAGFLCRKLAQLPKQQFKVTALLPAFTAAAPLLLVCVGITAVWVFWMQQLGWPAFTMDQAWITAAPLPIQVICVGVVVPLYEEYFYRAALQPALQKGTGKSWLACVIIGLLFALSHQSVTALPEIWLMGTMLGFAAYATGHFAASAALHAGYNLLIIFQDQLPYSQSGWPWFIYVGALLAAGLLLFLAYCLSPRGSRAKMPKSPRPAASWWSIVSAVCFCGYLCYLFYLGAIKPFV